MLTGSEGISLTENMAGLQTRNREEPLTGSSSASLHFRRAFSVDKEFWTFFSRNELLTSGLPLWIVSSRHGLKHSRCRSVLVSRPLFQFLSFSSSLCNLNRHCRGLFLLSVFILFWAKFPGFVIYRH